MLSARGATASKPKDRKIIRFRPAAGKNQLVRFCAQQIRESIARVVNRSARFASSGMNARGIAKFLSEERQHGRPGRLTQRRGRVVIEVNHSPISDQKSETLIPIFAMLPALSSPALRVRFSQRD